jgi:hypothetical protein
VETLGNLAGDLSNGESGTETPLRARSSFGAREAGATPPLDEPMHMMLNGLTPQSATGTHYF